MIQLRKVFTAIVASILLFVGVFVGNSSALAGNYSADSWDKLPTLSDNKPAVSDNKPAIGKGYYSRKDGVTTDKAFSKDNASNLSDSLSDKPSSLPRPDKTALTQSSEQQSGSYRNRYGNELALPTAQKNLEQTADDAEGGLNGVVDNVREKLNLDQPLYPGTKEFIGDVKDTVEDSVDAVQDTLTGGADNLTSGQRSYK